MDKNSFLYSFYEMTGLPVRMFLNDELVEDYGQAVISEEYDQELRRQFVDDSEGFSYQLTPELLLYGYICSSDEKEKRYIILGPLCAEKNEDSRIE